MATEAYRDEAFGRTVDVYSLGLVLFSLMSSSREPFLSLPSDKINHQIEEETLARSMRGEPIPALRDADPVLAAIIMKACAIYPQD